MKTVWSIESSEGCRRWGGGTVGVCTYVHGSEGEGSSGIMLLAGVRSGCLAFVGDIVLFA